MCYFRHFETLQLLYMIVACCPSGFEVVQHVMALVRYKWSVEQDACIIFFASREVCWEAIADILPHLCGQRRDLESIHLRAAALACHLCLFAFEQATWDQSAISSWIRTQPLGRFA